MNLTVETNAVPGGFGYTILDDGAPWIIQPFMPDLPGMLPWATEAEATAAAEAQVALLQEPPPQ